MSEWGDDVADAEVESALASVARPAARPEFREELRLRFCTEGHPAVREASVATFPDPSRARRRTFLRFGGLLAAAAILAIGFIVLESPAPRWKVLDVAGGSRIALDGREVPVDDRDALARALQRAKEIDVREGDLVLQIENLALFDVSQGTKVAFEGFDRRAPGNPYVVRVPSGRLRAITGPAFTGRTMKVSADVIDATITGTEFAIDYEEKGTCVCCLRGEIEVAAPSIGAAPRKIQPTTMCLVYREGDAPPKWGGVSDKHVGPLRALEERAREIWP
jgi:ferric-dicitrate binding protein FerR (iron transport regulator)